MSPADSLFLLAESRAHPMHVGGLQLFQPPDGATAMDVRQLYDHAIASAEPSALFRKRARRSLSSGGQWAWAPDAEFDLEHHVRRNALPAPGRVLELLALCSRLHGTLLDRHRPLWEMHLIEGLDDGRYAVYFKVHHAMVDGVAALRLMRKQLTEDPDVRGLPAPWTAGPADPSDSAAGSQPPAELPAHLVRSAVAVLGEAAGLPGALTRTVRHALRAESSPISFSAPRSMLNVPITSARRFAAQSWPIERIRQVGRAAQVTLNDVVLAMCAGALRTYLLSFEALPESPLIAMVPVSLRSSKDADCGGNSVGAVMVNLGTDQPDPAERLATIARSMAGGKVALAEMSPAQILAMTAIGMSPLLLPMLGLNDVTRPPFNLIISNVPGPEKPLYWNGARLDGLYPLSIPLDGQALNITCTSYSGQLAFGLTGCRRTLPHLQRLLGYLDDELTRLEYAAGTA